MPQDLLGVELFKQHLILYCLRKICLPAFKKVWITVLSYIVLNSLIAEILKSKVYKYQETDIRYAQIYVDII